MEIVNQFKEIFWDGFHKPSLKSQKFQTVWESLEHLNSLLAGPFYSILNQGNCDYVFDDKIRFPAISHPDDFFTRCIELTEKYKEEILKVPAESDEERQDKKVLLYQTDIKMELSDLSYQILKESAKFKISK